METVDNKQKSKSTRGRNLFGLKSLRIKILQKFIRVNPKQILFMANDGDSFDDSPRTAFELLQADPAYQDFSFVWAFSEPSDFDHDGITKKVSVHSFSYLRHLLRSKYWVTNSSVDQYLPFKHPNNIYVQLGNGVPLQGVGQGDYESTKYQRAWAKKVRFDYLFTYSSYDSALLQEVYPNADRYNQVGQLRKFALETAHKRVDKNTMMDELHFNPNKQTLLYVATDDLTPGFEKATPILGKEALTELSKKFNILYRGVGVKAAVLAVPGLINANKMDMNDLFVISDVLVTDYSNVLFDFSVERKPIYLYQSNEEVFADKRGLYLSEKEIGLPVAHNEKDLLHILLGDKELDNTSVEDVLTYYNPLPAQQAVDFLFEIIPANE